MRIIVFSIFLLLSFYTSFSQTDTTYSYLDSSWNNISKENSVYTNKLFKEGAVWHKQQVLTRTNVVVASSYVKDTATYSPIGPALSYYDNGVLKDSSFYGTGALIYRSAFYENGAKKAVITYDENGNLTELHGWDDGGNEIPNYIFEKEAVFPGGPSGWSHFLTQNIFSTFSKKQQKEYDNGEIWGDVVVSFLVLKDGSVSEVTVTRSSGFPDLDDAAKNLISKSPNWSPAIQYNKPVIYRQKQKLTYTKAEQ